jgi:hypothetical protein
MKQAFVLRRLPSGVGPNYNVCEVAGVQIVCMQRVHRQVESQPAEREPGSSVLALSPASPPTPHLRMHDAFTAA